MALIGVDENNEADAEVVTNAAGDGSVATGVVENTELKAGDSVPELLVAVVVCAVAEFAAMAKLLAADA